jgi:dihydroxy-acid dehydratase
MGGSTNAMIHLVAMARRAGVDLQLDRFDELARLIPVLANVRPSGKYLMEDFYYAGGIKALLKQLAPRLELSAMTVNGKTLGENIEDAKVHLEDVIHGLDDPIAPSATAIIKGNLAPDGCVMKPSAAESRLLKHRGPAVVFEDYNDMAARIDGDDLEVTADSVLILRNSGPIGGPGMPEWGMLPIPKKLLKEGVRDMLRISDARMSGTSYGACILHVSPESAVGGPLALVRTGDVIELDVETRSLNMLVDDAELQRRREAWQPRTLAPRGYERMFANHIRQAHDGCDFDFLEGTQPLPEPEIH